VSWISWVLEFLYGAISCWITLVVDQSNALTSCHKSLFAASRHFTLFQASAGFWHTQWHIVLCTVCTLSGNVSIYDFFCTLRLTHIFDSADVRICDGCQLHNVNVTCSEFQPLWETGFITILLCLSHADSGVVVMCQEVRTLFLPFAMKRVLLVLCWNLTEKNWSPGQPWTTFGLHINMKVLPSALTPYC
jgi:hypothetical protein